jgi:hypothetical protein
LLQNNNKDDVAAMFSRRPASSEQHMGSPFTGLVDASVFTPFESVYSKPDTLFSASADASKWNKLKMLSKMAPQSSTSHVFDIDSDSGESF